MITAVWLSYTRFTPPVLSQRMFAYIEAINFDSGMILTELDKTKNQQAMKSK